MGIDNPLPYLVINAACLGIGWLILRSSAFYRERIGELRHGRTQMIDGLRGWLALGVFFTHTATTWFYYTTGKWDPSGAPFYNLTGQVGVSLFFMITGFLFWTRVLRADGALDVKAFYRSRIRRIVPQYLVSVFAVLAVAAAVTGFSLHVDAVTLAKELRAWFSFGFMRGEELNGFRDAHIINAVYWTLAFEWAFYLALPFFGRMARAPVCFLLFGLVFLYGIRAPIVLNFLFGAFAAIAVENNWLSRHLARPWATAVPLAALASLLFIGPGYSVGLMALLFVFFLFVVRGNSLFGLLGTGGSRLLGTISYSIYLNHCIVLFVVMHLVNSRFPVASLSMPQYWGFVLLAALGAVLLSALSYRYVEYPFLRRGANRLDNRGANRAAGLRAAVAEALHGREPALPKDRACVIERRAPALYDESPCSRERRAATGKRATRGSRRAERRRHNADGSTPTATRPASDAPAQSPAHRPFIEVNSK